MHTILIAVPIQKDKKQELLDLIRSPVGHPFTKTNKGFISAESGFTEDEEGNVVWNLWEAWENKEDFDNYNATPERVEGSEFMNKFPTLLSGAPSMLWLDDFARITA